MRWRIGSFRVHLIRMPLVVIGLVAAGFGLDLDSGLLLVGGLALAFFASFA